MKMNQLKKMKMKLVKDNKSVTQKMVTDKTERFFEYKNMVLYQEASCNIAIIFLVLIILGLIVGEYYTE